MQERDSLRSLQPFSIKVTVAQSLYDNESYRTLQYCFQVEFSEPPIFGRLKKAVASSNAAFASVYRALQPEGLSCSDTDIINMSVITLKPFENGNVLPYDIS
jgi:hypothetical protein